MSDDPIRQHLEWTRDERDVLANALSLLSHNFPHIAFDPMQPTAFVLAVAGVVNELDDKARTASAELAALKIQHQADLKVMNERLTESIDRMLWRITQLRNELRAEQSAQRKAENPRHTAQSEGIPINHKRQGPKCPLCGEDEVPANTPRTVYACGTSDYDQRPGTLDPSERCLKWFGFIKCHPLRTQRQPELTPIVSVNTSGCEPMDGATAKTLGAMVKAATSANQQHEQKEGQA